MLDVIHVACGLLIADLAEPTSGGTVSDAVGARTGVPGPNAMTILGNSVLERPNSCCWPVIRRRTWCLRTGVPDWRPSGAPKPAGR